MLGTKRIFNTFAGVCLYLRPERLAHQNRRAVSGGSLARIDCPCHHRPDRSYWLAYIQALAGYGTMVVIERSGQ